MSDLVFVSCCSRSSLPKAVGVLFQPGLKNETESILISFPSPVAPSQIFRWSINKTECGIYCITVKQNQNPSLHVLHPLCFSVVDLKTQYFSYCVSNQPQVQIDKKISTWLTDSMVIPHRDSEILIFGTEVMKLRACGHYELKFTDLSSFS